jgi:two-component system, sensor histidine kinase and response regulator
VALLFLFQMSNYKINISILSLKLIGRFSFGLVIFAILNYPSLAQQNSTDSLQIILSKTAQDTNRVNILSQLAWQYMTSAPDKAIDYAKQGIALAQKLNYKKGEIILLNYLGDNFRRQGQYANGIDYAISSLKIAESVGDSINMADAYRLLGMIHSFSLNEYNIALDYHKKAQKVYEKSKDKKRIVALYGNITWVYYMMNQHLNEAQKLTNIAIELVKDLKDDQLRSWCINSQGLICSRLNKLDSAVYYFEQSNEWGKKANDRAIRAYNNNLIANILIQQKKYDQALSLYRTNLPSINQLNIKGLRDALYKGMSEIYSSKKQYDSAYFYFQKHIALRDSLLNWENTQKILVTQQKYKKQNEELAIKKLEAEKRNTITVLVIIIGGLTGFMFLIIKNNAERKKINKLLHQKNEEIALQNEEITQQNEELYQSQEEIASQRDMVEANNQKLTEINQTKDKLFAIIGHDLRSPINSLKGLLEILDFQKISPEEFMLYSQKLRYEVENVHFTLNNLLEWAYSQMQGLQTKPKQVQLYQLGQENLEFLAGVAESKHIMLENRIPASAIVWADADHVNLIFRNLISNALKFTPAQGSICLSAYLGSHYWHINVQDTGVGISPDNIPKLFNKSTHFSTTGTSQEKGTGLGLLFCQEVIEKNGGTIQVESRLHQGTTFTFTLPIPSQY